MQKYGIWSRNCHTYMYLVLPCITFSTKAMDVRYDLFQLLDWLKNGDKIYKNIDLFITWYLLTSSINQAMFCWSSNLSIDLFSGCSALLLVQPHHHVIFVWLFLLLPIISVFCSKFIRYLLVLIVFAAVGVDMQNCCHSSLCIPSPCLVRFLGQD